MDSYLCQIYFLARNKVVLANLCVLHNSLTPEKSRHIEKTIIMFGCYYGYFIHYESATMEVHCIALLPGSS